MTTTDRTFRFILWVCTLCLFTGLLAIGGLRLGEKLARDIQQSLAQVTTITTDN